MALTALLFIALYVWSLPEQPSGPAVLPSGAHFVPATLGGPSVLIVGAGTSNGVVDDLLTYQLSSIDVVVAETGNRQSNVVVSGIIDVADPGVVVAPPQHSIKGTRRLTKPAQLTTEFGICLLYTSPSPRDRG